MTGKTTALAKTGPTLKALLTSSREAIAALIPRHMDPDKVIRLAWLAAYREPKLRAADPVEVVQAVMRASSLGLMVGYDAHLLPFFNKRANRYDVVLIPDYRGLLGLARRAGVLDIDAKAVFMGEHFVVEYGSAPVRHHVPSWEAQRDYAHLIAVYAEIKLPNPGGSPIERWEVMTKTEVEAIRARSRAGQDGPWVTDPIEMAKKTVLRRAVKTLPQSPELAAALELDTRAETGRATMILPDDNPEELAADVAAKAAAKQAALRDKLADADGVVVENPPEEPLPVTQRTRIASKPQPVEEENWPEEGT